MKAAVQRLLTSTKDDVDRMYRQGLIDHATRRGYLAVWRWSAVRFGGVDDTVQNQFWNDHGQDEFYRRINRVRRACGFPVLTN